MITLLLQLDQGHDDAFLQNCDAINETVLVDVIIHHVRDCFFDKPVAIDHDLDINIVSQVLRRLAMFLSRCGMFFNANFKPKIYSVCSLT